MLTTATTIIAAMTLILSPPLQPDPNPNPDYNGKISLLPNYTTGTNAQCSPNVWSCVVDDTGGRDSVVS